MAPTSFTPFENVEQPMMLKKGLLMTLDKEDEAKATVLQLNKALRERQLSGQYYVKYFTHTMPSGGVTFALYCLQRKRR
jgi:hypothetical protein